MKTFFVMMMLMFSSIAFAEGKDGGNGGDAVLCPGKRPVLLDSIEMEKRKMTLSLPGMTMKSKILGVTSKIKKMDPYRGALVEQYALELESDIRKHQEGATNLSVTDFTQDELSDVPDSFELVIPKGCRKEQLVTQQNVVFAEDRRYTIAKNIWDKMELNQQTLTVLHESWYRVFIEDGALDSRFTRYMNGLFASAEHAPTEFKDYLRTLKLSKKIGSFGKGKRIFYKLKFFEVVAEMSELLWNIEDDQSLSDNEIDYLEGAEIKLNAVVDKEFEVRVSGQRLTLNIQEVMISRNGSVGLIRTYISAGDIGRIYIANLDMVLSGHLVLVFNNHEVVGFNGGIKALYENGIYIDGERFFTRKPRVVTGTVKDGIATYVIERHF